MAKAPPNYRLELGLRIKELRATKSITQEELADRCGMFRTYMSRIESGLANPTVTMLHAMAKGLDVDIQELFVQVQTPPPVRVRAAQPVSRGRVQR